LSIGSLQDYGRPDCKNSSTADDAEIAVSEGSPAAADDVLEAPAPLP
jgi:hypothetical protein